MTPQEYRAWLLQEVKAGRLNKAELECYHVRQEKPLFDSTNGEKMSVPSIQKYGIREWGTRPTEGVQDYLNSFNIQYEILFNPRETADEETNEESKEQPTTEKTAEQEGEQPTEQPKKGKSGKPAKTVNIEND